MHIGYMNSHPSCRIYELTPYVTAPYKHQQIAKITLVEFCLMQVKTMRVLQYFPTVEDPNTRRALFEVSLLFEIV